MNIDFFPERIKTAIEFYDINDIYEIRLRTGFPVFLRTSAGNITLKLDKSTLVCYQNDINEIISNVCQHSIYAYNDRIKEGFINANEGIRIGLAGDCVVDKGNVITIKNINSLNVRIPHIIYGCSNEIIESIFNHRIYNTLIVSPVGYGKTTLLKDLALNINQNMMYQTLVIDERGEFCSLKGPNLDRIAFCDKLYAFIYALRSMSPEVVITDELIKKADWDCVNYCSNCGVYVIASCHGIDINDVINKEYFIPKIFDRYVFINNKGKPKLINKVYDGDYNLL